MNKIIKSLVAASLIATTTLSADSFDYNNEFAKMHQLMNQVMSENFTHSRLANIGYPRVNVQDKAKEYIYEFDLAGVPKENIKLKINENNVLTLEGEKETKTKSDKDGYVKQEIFYGSFNRVIQLPEDAKQEALKTEYKNGILTLTFPKKEVKKLKEKVLAIP